MEGDFHRFRVGAFNCCAVSDGSVTYPTSMFFVNARKEEYDPVLREHGLPTQGESLTSCTSLYIESGKHRVLVDAGGDPHAPPCGRLARNLRQMGSDAGSIDTLIISHAHPDHIGGILGPNGQLTFPNARYVMAKDEWEFWMDKPDLETLPAGEGVGAMMLESVGKMLPPIRERVELMDGEQEILPGIRLVPSPGHTPGHLAIEVRSEGEVLLDVVDGILHPALVERQEWYSAFDLHPQTMQASRQLLLERAAKNGAAVRACHFPFPGLGRVAREGQGWVWKPAK